MRAWGVLHPIQRPWHLDAREGMGDSELTFASALLPFEGLEEIWGELEGWRFKHPEAEEDRDPEKVDIAKNRERERLSWW